jgi:hypothetical protein
MPNFDNNIIEYFCPACYVYWSNEKHEKITWPVTKNPQTKSCRGCSIRKNTRGVLSFEQKLSHIFKPDSRPSVIVPNKGDLTGIQFEMKIPTNIHLLKDDFEYALIHAVELHVSGKFIDKIYDHQIYQHDKSIGQIVFKGDEKIMIDLPFIINEKTPLFYSSQDEIKLIFEFGSSAKLLKDLSNNKVSWSIPNVIFTYQKNTIIKNSICNYTFYCCTNEESLQQQNGKCISTFSYTLKLDFLVDGITFGIYDQNDKEKSFNYLNIVDNINLLFNACDYIYENAEPFINENNVYTIKFKNPINFSAIESDKFNLKFKRDIIKKYNEDENEYKLSIFISALSNNKLVYQDGKLGGYLF